MIEQFYAIGHLTTEQLRELFSSNRNRGWVDYEYYKLIPEGGTPPELTDEEILFNEVKAVYAYCNLHSLWKA